MGDVPVAIAVAEPYVAGQHSSEGLVQGVAVGKPIESARKHRAPAAEPANSAVVAESFLYSPHMAKVFAQFDTDSDGRLDSGEMKQLLLTIGLAEDDASGAMPNFDRNGDGKIE
jgi:hypothetical protein